MRPLIPIVLLVLCSYAPHALAEFRFEPIGATPYDTQVGRIESFIRAAGKTAPDRVPTLEQVNRWISQLHRIPYEYSQHWKTPDELMQSNSGDCKAKAVCLYYLMRSYGARNVTLVIGRETASSSGTHTWLLWRSTSGYYILDPTRQNRAIEIRQTGVSRYIPHYAFASGKRFRLSLM